MKPCINFPTYIQNGLCLFFKARHVRYALGCDIDQDRVITYKDINFLYTLYTYVVIHNHPNYLTLVYN